MFSQQAKTSILQSAPGVGRIFVAACLLASVAMLAACGGRDAAPEGQAKQFAESSSTTVAEIPDKINPNGIASMDASIGKAGFPPTSPSSPPGNHTPTVRTDAAPAVALSKGMPYVAARKSLLDAGWKPQVTDRCMRNVVGGNFADRCSQQPRPAVCDLCAQMPELESCSGTGYCKMHFAGSTAAQMLQVTTYGPTRGWQKPDSEMVIMDWSTAQGAAERQRAQQ